MLGNVAHKEGRKRLPARPPGETEEASGRVKREGAARSGAASAPGWAWEGHVVNERGRGWQLLKGEIDQGRRTGNGSHALKSGGQIGRPPM